MLAAAGSFQPFVEYPGDNCCTLFQHNRLDGVKKRFCHDGSKTEFSMIEHGFNDQLSSYYCGKNTFYNFCKHGAVGCEFGNVFSGAGHILNGYVDRHNN